MYTIPGVLSTFLTAIVVPFTNLSLVFCDIINRLLAKQGA